MLKRQAKLLLNIVIKLLFEQDGFAWVWPSKVSDNSRSDQKWSLNWWVVVAVVVVVVVVAFFLRNGWPAKGVYALFPAGTIARGSDNRKSPTRREQDMNLRRIWLQTLLNEVVL